MPSRWNLWKRFRQRQRAKKIRQPFVGLVLALPGDDPEFPFTSLGLGCFHFGAKPEEFDGSAARHVEAVLGWLEGAEGITNAVVDDPEISWFENDLPFGLETGGQPLPAITRLRIEFDLHVGAPERTRHYPWEQYTEPLDVHVSIRQGPAVPIAFVLPRTNRETPTLAVSQVWHALRERIPEDASFFLDMRAPSPAPVAVFLVPLVEPDLSEVGALNFDHERVQLGVREPWDIFAYNPKHHDHAAALQHLLGELETPAGLYYEVIGTAGRLRSDYGNLLLQRDGLVERERRWRFARFLQIRWGEARLLGDLAIDLTQFEADVDAAKTGLAERRTELDRISPIPFLRDEIDEALRVAFRFNTGVIGRPLDLFERRRTTRSQNLAVLVGGIVAAVIGATSALWVAGARDAPTVTVSVISPSTATPPAPTTTARRVPRAPGAKAAPRPRTGTR